MLKKYPKICHEASKANGWWDSQRPFNEILVLIISELSEGLEALRKNRHADVEAYEDQLATRGVTFDKGLFETYIKDTVEDELADTAIRIFDLVGSLDVEGLQEKTISPCTAYPSMMLSVVEDLVFCIRPGVTLDDLVFHLEYALGALVSYCNATMVVLEWHIDQKLLYNQTRGYKHGNKLF